MSQLVRLEGKHTAQRAHCAVMVKREREREVSPPRPLPIIPKTRPAYTSGFPSSLPPPGQQPFLWALE